MERIPTPAFAEPAQWLKAGELQLHLVERDDIDPPGPGDAPAPIYMDE